jgi:hypothetical protein
MLTKLKKLTVLALLYILTLLAAAPEHARADSPGNCAEEVNLSSRGVEQAKRIGETFRAHGIVVEDVLTSPLLPLHRHRRACVWSRDARSISQATGYRV